MTIIDENAGDKDVYVAGAREKAKAALQRVVAKLIEVRSEDRHQGTALRVPRPRRHAVHAHCPMAGNSRHTVHTVRAHVHCVEVLAVEGHLHLDIRASSWGNDARDAPRHVL